MNPKDLRRRLLSIASSITLTLSITVSSLVFNLLLWKLLPSFDNFYLMFIVAVAFCAWFNGFWTGVQSMAIAIILADIFLFRHIYSPTSQLIGSVLFIFVAFFVTFIIEKLRNNAAFLIKQEKRKDAFISMVSHELKTPLTSISAFVQVLEMSMEKKRHDEETKIIIKKTAAQVKNLVELVNELLDVGKIQQGRMQLKKTAFSLDALVKETVESIQLTTKTHEIKIRGRVGKRVCADRERITQVLMNLLTNAIKYSPEKHLIYVILDSTKRYAYVAVKDNGIGIPIDTRERIFDLFYRADNKSRQSYPGLGIGLYVSSQILQRHKGKISVESTPEKGSEFKFRLPLYKDEK